MFSRHKRGHGIHSPFVFDLISRVFRNKTADDIVFKIEDIRKRCLTSGKTISVLDIGAGSSKMKGNIRKVSDIVRYSAVPEKYGILLSSLAAEFGKPAIVEFGTSLGISTLYLASASPESTVYSMEACSNTAGIAMDNFREAGINNIKVLNGTFDEMVPELVKEAVRPGMVFIDGDHRKESVLRYFEQMIEMSDSKTVIVLDDIHFSQDMEEAWDQIKKHKAVAFTIDLYRMGLVFFREGMNRFHYLIRY